MSTTLSQILGVLAGVKTKTDRAITEAHHDSKRPALLAGLHRTYRPHTDGDITYPPESTEVQKQALDLYRLAVEALKDQARLVFSVDETNRTASADIVLPDGTVLASDVPGVTLLYLEKKLTDMATMVDKLPVLNPGERWTLNLETGVYETPPAETLKMRKVKKSFVAYEATEKHPAQVQVYDEDVPVGTWTTVTSSGAMSPVHKAELALRVESLHQAVRFARERANATEVRESADSARILDYLLDR